MWVEIWCLTHGSTTIRYVDAEYPSQLIPSRHITYEYNQRNHIHTRVFRNEDKTAESDNTGLCVMRSQTSRMALCRSFTNRFYH
jgi:hypothetical protein